MGTKLTREERERLWRNGIRHMVLEFTSKDWVETLEEWVGANKLRQIMAEWKVADDSEADGEPKKGG